MKAWLLRGARGCILPGFQHGDGEAVCRSDRSVIHDGGSFQIFMQSVMRKQIGNHKAKSRASPKVRLIPRSEKASKCYVVNHTWHYGRNIKAKQDISVYHLHNHYHHHQKSNGVVLLKAPNSVVLKLDLLMRSPWLGRKSRQSSLN